MQKRTFVLGAGFSKAIAEGPLMCELYSNMQRSYQFEKGRKDVIGGNNRVVWFEDLDNFIKDLESLEDTFRNNLEYLVTLLDLRIDSISGQFIVNNTDINDIESMPLAAWSREKMRYIRDVFATYLFLCLEKLSPNDVGLKFCECIREEDSILTFNYDIVLEKALWRMNKWTPREGYVGVSELESPDDVLKLSQSPIKLLKLHGSLNWLAPEELPKANVRVGLDNLENWGFFFENLQKLLGRKPRGPSGTLTREISKGYAGGINPYWFLPSYVKPFETKNELKVIWEKAKEILEITKNIVIVGYSFRKEDEHTKSLFESSLPKDCEITIIDPNWDTLRSSLEGLGFSSIKGVESLEQWLKEN